MSTWVTHLMIADRVLECIPELCRHEFCVGSIAPDCNVENEDWTQFTPSREITHWMSGEMKMASDCERFFSEYIEKRKDKINSAEEISFLLGYYAHLAADAEYQRYNRDTDRVKAVWKRIKSYNELREMSEGMEENWDSVELLIAFDERKKDIHSIEREYLENNPGSGYLTEIMGLEYFPDYIDYLPAGAIVRKVGIMGHMPQTKTGRYPYIAMSKKEYSIFIDSSANLVISSIRKSSILNEYQSGAASLI